MAILTVNCGNGYRTLGTRICEKAAEYGQLQALKWLKLICCDQALEWVEANVNKGGTFDFAAAAAAAHGDISSDSNG